MEELREETMGGNLLNIQLTYLRDLYSQMPEDLELSLLAIRENQAFHFRAFGEPCSINSQGITLGVKKLSGPRGILIALYAYHTRNEAVQIKPLKSFKQIKGSLPYHKAFTFRSEKSIVPYVSQIQSFREKIIKTLDGHENKNAKGDWSFTLYPLPKIPLYYIFYLADEEFPASVTCLFASNAELFMPVDGLADVGEYTAKKIIEIVTTQCPGT